MEEHVIHDPKNYRKSTPARRHERSGIVLRCKVNGEWVYRADFKNEEEFRKEIGRLHDQPRRS